MRTSSTRSMSVSIEAAALILLLPSLAASLSSCTSAAPSVPDRAPSWSTLKSRVVETPTGARLAHEADLRTKGLGPPHVDAKLRLFDSDTTNEDDVRVIFYRDSSAWCPYCQKVWLCLEEKRIPYICKTVPLNAYGDKPAWYTRLVDGGKLPAMELDGRVLTESLDIIGILDETFANCGPNMIPIDSEDKKNAESLLQLEKELQSAWFSLVFYPVEGDSLIKAQDNFIDTLKKVDDALQSTSGPWFLGGMSPSMVDVQYISHVERIVASVLYWKGMDIRNTGQFPNIDRWLEAFEDRPSYMATKSDHYTLVMSIPSQNGPGYSIDDAREAASKIYGLDGAWSLPLANVQKDPLLEEAHRHEAAFALTTRHEVVTTFATRGAGEPGRPSFHAELSDPHAEPNENYIAPVDICLRHVAAALLDGTECAEAAIAACDLAGRAGDGTLREYWDEYTDKDGQTYWWNDITGDVAYTAPTMQLDTCLAYLRDRIGVPRDMGAGAALQLRAHLNWAIGLLNRNININSSLLSFLLTRLRQNNSSMGMNLIPLVALVLLLDSSRGVSILDSTYNGEIARFL